MDVSSCVFPIERLSFAITRPSKVGWTSKDAVHWGISFWGLPDRKIGYSHEEDCTNGWVDVQKAGAHMQEVTELYKWPASPEGSIIL